MLVTSTQTRKSNFTDNGGEEEEDDGAAVKCRVGRNARGEEMPCFLMGVGASKGFSIYFCAVLPPIPFSNLEYHSIYTSV